LIGLGEAQRQVGDQRFRDTLLEATYKAIELGDADRACRAAIANNRGMASVVGETDEQRIAALEQALELDRFSDPARSARLISLQAMELMFEADHERRRSLAHEALTLAREAADPRTLTAVLRDCFYATWAPDTLELRSGIVDELLEISAHADDPALEAWTAVQELDVAVEGGDLERAEAAGQRFSDLADQLGQPTLRFFATFTAASLALVAGNLGVAESMAEDAFQIGNAAGEPDAILVYGAQLSNIRTWQGRGEETIEMLEETIGAFPGLSGLRAGLAWTYCWCDRREKAAAIVEHAAGDGFDHVPWDLGRSIALAAYADAASQTGV
jgi:ATP/maltotriose-dependent transcriptional regulator MalT